MSRKNLKDILKNKKERKKEHKETDLEQKKDEFINYVEDLYKNVEEWLRGYEKDLISFDKEEITLSQNTIGEYRIKKLILNMPGEKAELKPHGFTVVGAKGRVDLVGRNGSVKLVLVPQESKSIGNKNQSNKVEQNKDEESRKFKWKYATEPPEINLHSLNKDLFEDLLTRVIND